MTRSNERPEPETIESTGVVVQQLAPSEQDAQPFEPTEDDETAGACSAQDADHWRKGSECGYCGADWDESAPARGFDVVGIANAITAGDPSVSDAALAMTEALRYLETGWHGGSDEQGERLGLLFAIARAQLRELATLAAEVEYSGPYGDEPDALAEPDVTDIEPSTVVDPRFGPAADGLTGYETRLPF